MSLLALFSARNEAYHLPHFLPHLAPYVDGFVALDDGSTDDTRRLLDGQPKMLDVLSNPPRADDLELREPENRRRLLARARALGAGWAICLDPDERLELGALRRLHELVRRAQAENKTLVNFRLRELWDSPFHYRVDGVWGRKTRMRLFAIPDPDTFQGAPLHGPWHPDERAPAGKVVHDGASIYHLKMIRAEDRVRRRELYERLDPGQRFQPVEGYAYLTDETSLSLHAIPPWRAYARSSIPPDLLPLRPRLDGPARLRAALLPAVEGGLSVVRRALR